MGPPFHSYVDSPRVVKIRRSIRKRLAASLHGLRRLAGTGRSRLLPLEVGDPRTSLKKRTLPGFKDGNLPVIRPIRESSQEVGAGQDA